MLGARALSRARPGGHVRLRLALARVRGATSLRTISVPVPRGLRSGPALLLLKGTAADTSSAGPSTSLIQILTVGRRARRAPRAWGPTTTPVR